MRPELQQFVVDPAETGSVNIFHTNDWPGVRQTGNHWKGDLPGEISHAALTLVKDRLAGQGWDLSPEKTKILMLTHRVLAGEQGYRNLPEIFEFNEAFAKKEHGHIAYFVDFLEPACKAFSERQYGAMFAALGSKLPSIRNQADKSKWSVAMDRLIYLRDNGTVGDVIAHLRDTQLPRLPDSVEQRERELELFDRAADGEMPRALSELDALHSVSYQEIVALTGYHNGNSPFETKHGVKGAEFENVIVVTVRGWNQYNFSEMLELAHDVDGIPSNKQAAFERNRNLFYVVCSRPKKRLAVLFTQELSSTAMQTVQAWFGSKAIEAVEI